MPGFASGIVLDRDTSLPCALFINYLFSVFFRCGTGPGERDV